MASEITLAKFQGPLDLLLQLIEQEELSITEVAIGQVTEQFFKYLQTLDEQRSDELADFLVIATKLVYLKSKQLLPYLQQPEVDEGPSLADQLKLYQRYANASHHIAELWETESLAYCRVEPPIPMEGFVLPANAYATDLHLFFTLLLKRLKPIAALPVVSIDYTLSVKEKIESIYKALQQWKKVSFHDILEQVSNRTEVIVSFLALLELVKQERVSVQQHNSLEELMIYV